MNLEVSSIISREFEQQLENGLSVEEAAVEPRNYIPLSVRMASPSGELAAGLTGATYWRWLHIKLLWVSETLRRQGIGSQLVLAAEKEARSRGCIFSLVDTFSFQAPEFYKRLGYEELASLKGFPPGASRIYFWKEL